LLLESILTLVPCEVSLLMSLKTRRSCRAALALAILACLFDGTLYAQAAEPPEDLRLVAAGWNALANGDAGAATRIAAELTQQPSSNVAVLAFAVETALWGGDSLAGLRAYESWLGGRTTEAPYALRRIAVALLRAEAGQDSSLRVRALTELARDGDQWARGELSAGGRSGELGAIIATAALGHEEAIEALAGKLAEMHAQQDRAIQALGESGSSHAVPVLRRSLSSQRFDVIAAAARALGQLPASEAIPDLQRLLDHHYPDVRLAAAEALYRLGDDSGVPVLETFAASEHAGVRIAAMEAMASRPHARWQAAVRELIEEDDPVIRLRAARLLAEQDHETAAATLAALMEDSNPAVREAAGIAASARSSDFAVLRRLLGGADLNARVRAAGRVLELTR
jgi:HEAT repeat protein